MTHLHGCAFMCVCMYVCVCSIAACLLVCHDFSVNFLICMIAFTYVFLNVRYSEFLLLLMFVFRNYCSCCYLPSSQRQLNHTQILDEVYFWWLSETNCFETVPLFREKKKRKAKKWAWIKPNTSDIKRSKVCHNWWLLRPTCKRHHTIRESSFLLVYYLTNCCTADFPQLFPTCWVPNKYRFVRQIFVWQHSRSRDLLWPGREALCWCQQQQSETLLADRLKPMHTLPQTVCCVSRRACCAAIHKYSFICRGSSWVTWNEGQRPWIHRSARRFQRVTRLIWTVSQTTTHFRKRHLYVKCAFVYLSI